MFRLFGILNVECVLLKRKTLKNSFGLTVFIFFTYFAKLRRLLWIRLISERFWKKLEDTVKRDIALIFTKAVKTHGLFKVKNSVFILSLMNVSAKNKWWFISWTFNEYYFYFPLNKFIPVILLNFYLPNRSIRDWK